MANKAYVTVQITGLQEAIKKLDGFNKAIRYRVTRDAVNAGAGVLRDAAKRNAPKESKLLKNNLTIRTFVPKNDSGIYCKIGAKRKVKKPVYVLATGKGKGQSRVLSGKKLAAVADTGAQLKYRSPSRYIHLVEFGTKKHLIQAKNASILSNGVRSFGLRAMVGAKPRQFMQFTARAMGKSAIARATAKIKKETELELRKIAVKAVVRAVRRSDR